MSCKVAWLTTTVFGAARLANWAAMWGGVPQSWLHAPVTTAQGAYHRYARVNSHLHSEFYTVLPLELLRQPRHAPRDVQCRMHSPSSIVFMSARVSKVHHKPITKMLGHPPIETLDDLVTHALHLLDNLMDLFGIK